VTRSAVTGTSTGRVVFAVILGVIAIAFLVVGIVYCLEPSGSLPAWLGRETVQVGKQQLPASTYRPLRAVGSLITGVVFAIGTWFSLAYKAKVTTTSVTGVTEVS
jgi:hypothetical protein